LLFNLSKVQLSTHDEHHASSPSAGSSSQVLRKIPATIIFQTRIDDFSQQSRENAKRIVEIKFTSKFNLKTSSAEEYNKIEIKEGKVAH
jgi:hypothetical protein